MKTISQPYALPAVRPGKGSRVHTEQKQNSEAVWTFRRREICFTLAGFRTPYLADRSLLTIRTTLSHLHVLCALMWRVQLTSKYTCPPTYTRCQNESCTCRRLTVV